MALDFPSNPTNGQVFGSYIWNSTVGAWQAREESAAVAVTSPTAPTEAKNGDIWYNTTRGVSYVYYDDGSSSQWVEVVTSGTPELSTKADLSYTNTQLALKANLSGGNTFTGTQTFNTPIAIASGGTGNNTGVNLIPTGAMMMWYTNTAPTGWLLCDGQSTAAYPALAAIVGANVPNLKGRVPVGRDSADASFDILGETGGAKTHTLTVAEMPSHRHNLQIVALSQLNQQVNDDDLAAGNAPPAANGPTAMSNAGGDQPHNNLQPYIVVNYIIKT